MSNPPLWRQISVCLFLLLQGLFFEEEAGHLLTTPPFMDRFLSAFSCFCKGFFLRTCYVFWRYMLSTPSFWRIFFWTDFCLPSLAFARASFEDKAGVLVHLLTCRSPSFEYFFMDIFYCLTNYCLYLVVGHISLQLLQILLSDLSWTYFLAASSLNGPD